MSVFGSKFPTKSLLIENFAGIFMDVSRLVRDLCSDDFYRFEPDEIC